MTNAVNLKPIFFLITILLQVSCYVSPESKKCVGSSVIGTVLYTPSDVHKQCWSPDEIAVLTTRMILEDLFPDSSKLNIDSNEYVDDLIEYFKTIIEVVRKTTNGRKKHVVLLALTDLIGGYFHHIILPIARHAYYAGYLDFTNVERLIQMYEELKWFLRTNGQGWSRPITNVPELEADAINLKTETPKRSGNKSCCSKLVYWEKETPNKKCHKGKVGIDRFVHFPMPFFDSKNQPTAIVVPFRRYPVRNIESRKGAYLVMKFFVSGYQCLIDRKANKASVETFQNNMYAWIIDDILPKLYDNKFYSSFGGVLRIVETLKSLGASPVSHTLTTANSCDEQEIEPGAIAKEATTTKKSNIIAMIMILIILIWFCIGTAFICHRTRKAGGLKSDKCKENLDKLPAFVKSCPPSVSSERISSIFSKSSCSKKSSSRKSKSGSDGSSTFSSESERKDKSKKRTTACYSPQKRGVDDRPAVIDVKHTMKTLSSIEEISENSSRHDRHKKRISFEEPSVIMKPCPHHCSVKRKCSDCRCDPLRKDGKDSPSTSSPSTKGETTEDTEGAENLACHSSLTGDYRKPNSTDEQMVFGYDFHTTSTSEMSEEEMDSKTSTSNSHPN